MEYILYHANCYDGFGAAFAAWKHFGNGAKYIPVSYGQPVPDIADADAVYLVDFSYPFETLWAMAEHKPLVVLDHHKTAQEALEKFNHSNAKIIFDMNKSGALLAWEYFHKREAPKLIQHISDRDLWIFNLDGTKAIHKALVSLPMDFEVWDKLDVEQLKIDGAAMERLHDQLVKNICSQSWVGRIDEYNIPMVNTSIAWSEVGHELLDQNPTAPFVASFTVMKNSIMWSLRSKDEFDVSAVAKKFGGGGHKNAAGFKTTKY